MKLTWFLTFERVKNPPESVLPFLAISRQIRDFGHTPGDTNLGLAIDRQSAKIRDFEAPISAILAKV